MRLPFTSRTYVAVSIARGIAAGNGHSDLAPSHVALGILREGENPAVAALYNAGVSLPKLRHDLEAQLPSRGRVHFGEIELSATAGEQDIVERAAAEASRRTNEYLGTEHLLLALLADSAAPVAQTFARHGVTYDVAVTQLSALRENRQQG